MCDSGFILIQYYCDGHKDYLNSEKFNYDCDDGSDEGERCCNGNHPAYNNSICKYYSYSIFGRESKNFTQGVIFVIY